MCPVTALLLPDLKTGGQKKVKFHTGDSPEHLSIDIYQCDEDWKEVGKPTEGTHLLDEEKYHKELRKEASIRGHFVKEHSTNPEWSPDYIENKDENIQN